MPTDLLTRAAGSRPVARAAAGLSGRRLRILAYHDVPDAGAFDAQLAHLAAEYTPVDAAAVVAAVTAGAPLPPRAVWVTFDDGFASVVEQGLPVLARHGVRATLFVCPAAVETGEPLWPERARAALGAGWRPPGFEDHGVEAVVRWLKRSPDARRREVVATAGLVAGTRPMATEAQLRAWVDAGQDVGNHTWDHPCLDTCEAGEQRRQVLAAAAWLDERFPDRPPVFAYPNGDWAAPAEAALDEAGERVGVLFDHRLARIDGDRRRLSRLRVSAGAPIARFRAIVSGAHSALFHLRR